jgi:CheY-like chemotaxis protein
VTVHLDPSSPFRDVATRYLVREHATVADARMRNETSQAAGIHVIQDGADADAWLARATTQQPAARFVVLTERDDRIVDARFAISVRCCPFSRTKFLDAVCCAAGRRSPFIDQVTPVDTVTEAIDVETGEREGRLVLVAEDNEANQTVIAQQLATLGYACVIAEDGAAALEQIERRSFALVLADCHMPRMDGFMLTKAIRGHRSKTVARLPIVAITANAFAGEAERCRREGMDDYLAKPVAMTEIRSILRRYVDEENEATIDAGALARVVGKDPDAQQRIALRVALALDAGAKDLAAANDRAEQRRLAHKLKSSARTVGAGVLGDELEALENVTPNAEAHEVEGKIRRSLRLLTSITAIIRRTWTGVLNQPAA